MNFVEVSYILDGKTYTETFDTEMRFSTLKDIIRLTHKLNINDYEFFYMNKKLGDRYHWLEIKDIAKSDINPIFTLTKINSERNNTKSPRKTNLDNQTVKVILSDLPPQETSIDRLRKLIEPNEINTRDLENNRVYLPTKSVSDGIVYYKRFKEEKLSNPDLKNISIKLEISNKRDWKFWEETDFMKTLDLRLNEYEEKCMKHNTSPMKDQAVYNHGNLSTRMSSEILLSESSSRRIKNNMDFNERLNYIKSNFKPKFLSVSDPFIEYRILKKDVYKKKSPKFTSRKDFNKSPRLKGQTRMSSVHNVLFSEADNNRFRITLRKEGDNKTRWVSKKIFRK